MVFHFSPHRQWYSQLAFLTIVTSLNHHSHSTHIQCLLRSVGHGISHWTVTHMLRNTTTLEPSTSPMYPPTGPCHSEEKLLHSDNCIPCYLLADNNHTTYCLATQYFTISKVLLSWPPTIVHNSLQEQCKHHCSQPPPISLNGIRSITWGLHSTILAPEHIVIILLASHQHHRCTNNLTIMKPAHNLYIG